MKKCRFGIVSFAIFTAAVFCGACSESTSLSTQGRCLDVSDCPAGYNIIIGTTSDDIIYGTEGNDCIYDPSGNDTIYGLGGDDFIIAGDGNDNIYGGDGDDTIFAEAGNDWIYGQDGNDTLVGGDGNDHVYGGAGNDSMAGDDGNDYLQGGAGDDIIAGGEGNDRFSGGDGDDTCIDDDGNNAYNGCEDIDPLSVFMASTLVQKGPAGVSVQWATGSERNNAGFHVYRMDGNQSVRLTKRLIPGQVAAALGTTYSFTDLEGRAGDRYLIEDVDVSGRKTLHDQIQVSDTSAGMLPRLRDYSPKPAKTSPLTFGPGTTSVVKLMVSEPGLQLIGFDLLVQAGLDPAALTQQGLALTRQGQPLPLISSADGFRFVGLPEKDRYADFEVVKARAGSSQAMSRRRVQACANPRTVVAHELELEQDLVYYLASPTEDPFFWALAVPGTPAELGFDVPGLIPGPAKIQLDLCGTSVSSGPDHGVAVWLNGSLLAKEAWEGRDIHPTTIAVPAGLLQEQQNVLRVESLHDADVLFADRIAVTHQRSLQIDQDNLQITAAGGGCLRFTGLDGAEVHLLDVTNPKQPVELSGFVRDADTLTFKDTLPGQRTYLLAKKASDAVPKIMGPERKINTAHLAADYLVITHPDFSQAAGLLAAHHNARGLETLIVTTEQAYDTFNHGRPSPQAINDLINWVAPAQVLLLGGATVDSNDHLGVGNADFVPAHFVKTAGHNYEAASDRSYVPDGTAIGRLAVQTPQQALAVVAKITGWQAEHKTGRMLFVADKDINDYSRFERSTEYLIDTCAADSSQVERLYVSSSPDPGVELQTRADKGIDLVTFKGHAFMTGWSSPPMVTTAEAAGYENDRKFLLLSFTCFDGAFTGPWGEALAWGFVRNPDGGAIAALASSSLTDPHAIGLFAEQVVCQLTSGKAATLGQALQNAGHTLSGLTPALDDSLATFNILGDPATPNPWYVGLQPELECPGR
jgi:peptidase C25-like protein/hemolysin type calcium-binding protein